MKRQGWFGVVLALVLGGIILAGCNSHLSIGYKGSTHKSEQKIRMQRNFRYSTGTENNYFTVKEPGEYNIYIQAKMDEGQVQITLSKDGNVVFDLEGDDLQKRETIHLEAGKYLITLVKKSAKKASLTMEISRK